MKGYRLGGDRRTANDEQRIGVIYIERMTGYGKSTFPAIFL